MSERLAPMVNRQHWGKEKEMPTIDQVFAVLPERFNAAAARRMNSVIQFNLSGDGDNAGQYHTIIKDGTLEVKKGVHPSPSMTVTMAGSDYVAMMTGKLADQLAFMSGKLKITGDMRPFIKMKSLFKLG